MTRFQKIGVAGLCMALAVSAVVPSLLRGAAPGRAAASPAPAAGRTPEKIFSEIEDAQSDATKIMPSLALLADPDFRSADGQKVIPMLKKMVGLWVELGNAVESKDEKEDVRINRFRFMAFVSALGDKETNDRLAEIAKSKDSDALSAKTAILFSDWVTHSKDAAAQAKIIEDFTPVMKDNASSDEVVATLGAMSNLGSASNDVTKQLIEAVRTNMKADSAKSLLAQLDGEQEQIAMVGKPLAIQGRTSTGGTFSSMDYKGKVVLLDFWATWCGPCIGELPNVKKAYADYHDKGFEIVGLSCDADDDVLNTFTQKNMMPWIQLREASQNERENWHPIAKKFHVDGIPTMFLIDRKGTLRFVDAREDLPKKVAQLLAETDSAASQPAPVTK